MTIRPATSEDYERIRDLGVFPSGMFPETGLPVIAENDNKEIVGFLFGQAVVHTEPVWVREDTRGQRVPEKLFEVLAKELKTLGARTVYAFSSSAIVDKIARNCGFIEKPWKLFERTL